MKTETNNTFRTRGRWEWWLALGWPVAGLVIQAMVVWWFFWAGSR